jgi:DNA-binding CsgD family transcriptional regulator
MTTPLSKATPQQRRVAEAWRRKASLKAAAAELRISYSTAKSHIDNLCERTGARGSADIFYWLGIEAGLGSLRSDLVPGANANLR